VEVKHIRGTMVMDQPIYKDERGWFRELYKQSNFFANGFKQDNLSFSKKGVMRGLHYQIEPNAQAKYITVISGKITDIIVDIRKDSPTFGQYMKVELSGENGRVVFMPEGCAHGFIALEDTYFLYKCSNEYNKKAERCIFCYDDFLDIDWGKDIPIVPMLSEKDKQGKKFKELFLINEGEIK
jgi:dTDP-4-dehydrorhamnose 3,5-epimerase